MLLIFNKINKYSFDAIYNGKKKIETRAATSKYRKIKEGDILTFSCDGERFEKRVLKVLHFKNVDDMLKVFEPKDINPKLKTKKEMIEMYNSFPSYETKIKEFGILAFELK